MVPAQTNGPPGWCAMRKLGAIFLLLFLLKVLLIGVDNFIGRFALPALIMMLVFGMLLFSRSAVVSLDGLGFVRPTLLMLTVFLVSAICGVVMGMPVQDAATACLRAFTMALVLIGAYLSTLYGLQKMAEVVLLAAVVIHVGAALVLYPFGVGEEVGGYFRPSGIAGSTQLVANIAAFGVVLYAARLMCGGKNDRTVAIIVIALSATFVVVGLTLKNFIAVSAIVFLMVWRNQSRHRVLISIAGVMILAATATYALVALPIGERLAEVAQGGVDLDVVQGDKLESSLMWRLLHWSLLVQDWYDRFLVTGAGFGQVQNMRGLKTYFGDGYIAHSDWVGLFVELGPVLFVVFALSLARIYGVAKSAAVAGHLEYQGVRYSLLLFILMALAGNVFYSVAFAYLFWFALGLVAARVQQRVMAPECAT